MEELLRAAKDDIEKDLSKKYHILKPKDFLGLGGMSEHESVLGRCLPDWKRFNNLVGGIKTKEMSILTGHSGKGKTTFAMNLLFQVMESMPSARDGAMGLTPCAYMSFENSNEKIIEKLIEMRTGKKLRKYDSFSNTISTCLDDEEIMEHICRLDELPLYLIDPKEAAQSGYLDTSWVCDRIMKLHSIFKVKFFIVDHLHYFLNVHAENDFMGAVDKAVRDLRQITNRIPIHLVLIVQPPKAMTDGKGNVIPLGLYSGKGSSTITQEADNYWTVDRIKYDNMGEDVGCALFNCLKNRDWGDLGKIIYRWDKTRFIETDWE